MKCFQSLILTAALLAPTAALFGQASTSQITGQVSDPSDAVISGAKVRIANLETGEARNTTTSESGYFTAPLLEPGRYEVTITAAGFKPVTRTNITLQVDQVARMDFKLEIGSASEVVRVEA